MLQNSFIFHKHNHNKDINVLSTTHSDLSLKSSELEREIFGVDRMDQMVSIPDNVQNSTDLHTNCSVSTTHSDLSFKNLSYGRNP